MKKKKERFPNHVKMRMFFFFTATFMKNAFIMVVMSDFGLICGAVLVFLGFGNTSIFLYAGGT